MRIIYIFIKSLLEYIVYCDLIFPNIKYSDIYFFYNSVFSPGTLIYFLISDGSYVIQHFNLSLVFILFILAIKELGTKF